MRLPTLVTAAVATAVSLALAAPAGASTFAPTSAWDAPLAPTASLTPDSAALVANLDAQVASAGVWINTTQYSIPVFRSGRVSARPREARHDLPPAAARVRRGADPRRARRRRTAATAHGRLQPATDRCGSSAEARHAADGWHARWGGKMTPRLPQPGHFAGTARRDRDGAAAARRADAPGRARGGQDRPRARDRHPGRAKRALWRPPSAPTRARARVT